MHTRCAHAPVALVRLAQCGTTFDAAASAECGEATSTVSRCHKGRDAASLAMLRVLRYREYLVS